MADLSNQVIRYTPIRTREGVVFKEEPVRARERRPFENVILQGDARIILRDTSDSSVDLIITSPPYADSRKKPMAVIIQTNMLPGFCLSQKNSCASLSRLVPSS